MESKNNTIESTKKLHIDYRLEPPNNCDLNQTNQSQVQQAFNAFFNTFFQQHPEVLNQIFQRSNTLEKKPSNIQLPKISRDKRKAVLLTLQEKAEDDSEDLDINEIKKAHIQKHYLTLE